MALADLEKEFKKARKAWRADKSDKKLKKAWKAAKVALEKAKEAAEAGVKSPVEGGDSVEDLEEALKSARKAWKANKDDKALKKAFKSAKAALEEAKSKQAENQSSGEEESSEDGEEQKVDIDALKAAVKAARKEFKKDKSNKEAKKALKAAKAALEAAEAKASASGDAEEEGDNDADMAAESTAGKKRSLDEANGSTENGGDDAETSWEALSAKKQKTAPAFTDPNAPPPNPKCFVGNLSWDIDDDATRAFFKDCGELTDIYWLKDRETERFKGCGFITFETVEQAQKAVEKAGEDLMGRPIKINFAKPRPGGDRKTPRKSGGGVSKEPSPRPEGGTTTVFVGNLSFNIDDDQMRDFAKGCGEIYKIRWLSDRESGQFKGCGFIDFDAVESVDNFVKKNGESLMGRNIRIDYATPRN
eukprot:CAMPEP_0197536260 /NCGR_PEP_ID=MMETSP1318-20131121/53435_1 /TAXON_ID=552666 /ORGANISM="Partenskyella glossopodia, Strain RCC365" /LENGTH=417 /DNA_ID=CAMNT_0043094105 /DNA_START=35 /DNA_END=1288 /DNA_ORIENTATION=-